MFRVYTSTYECAVAYGQGATDCAVSLQRDITQTDVNIPWVCVRHKTRTRVFTTPQLTLPDIADMAALSHGRNAIKIWAMTADSAIRAAAAGTLAGAAMEWLHILPIGLGAIGGGVLGGLVTGTLQYSALSRPAAMDKALRDLAEIADLADGAGAHDLARARHRIDLLAVKYAYLGLVFVSLLSGVTVLVEQAQKNCVAAS